MRKVMFVFVVGVAVLTGGMSSLAADFGPYYINLDSSCEVFEVYLTPELLVYGLEIGCGSNSVVSGYVIPKDMVLLTNCYQGHMQFFQLKFNFQVLGYANFGDSLSAPVQLGTWSLGSSP